MVLNKISLIDSRKQKANQLYYQRTSIGVYRKKTTRTTFQLYKKKNGNGVPIRLEPWNKWMTRTEMQAKHKLTWCMIISVMRHWSDMSLTIVIMLSSSGRINVGPNTMAKLRGSICITQNSCIPNDVIMHSIMHILSCIFVAGIDIVWGLIAIRFKVPPDTL